MTLEIRTKEDIYDECHPNWIHPDNWKEKWVSVESLQDMLNSGVDALDFCEQLRKEFEK